MGKQSNGEQLCINTHTHHHPPKILDYEIQESQSIIHVNVLPWNFLLLSINTLLTRRIIFLVYRLQFRDISGIDFSFKKIKSEEAVNLSCCPRAALRFHLTYFQKENSTNADSCTLNSEGFSELSISCRILLFWYCCSLCIINLFIFNSSHQSASSATEPFAKERRGSKGCYYQASLCVLRVETIK